jgi:hypothetical protein
MNSAPSGPSDPEHGGGGTWTAPPPRELSEQELREDALRATLMVCIRLDRQDTVSAFWREQGFLRYLFGMIDEIFDLGHIEEVKCRHSELGVEWDIVNGPLQKHPYFIVRSAAIIDAVLIHMLTARGARAALTCPVLLWALRACMRYSLFIHAKSLLQIFHCQSVPVAGHDPRWIAAHAERLRLARLQDYHAPDFTTAKIQELHRVFCNQISVQEYMSR